MKVGIDLRCLQDNWRTGVGEYAWQTIQELSRLSPASELLGYTNAQGQINLPAGCAELVKISRQNYPNRLKNLSFYINWSQINDVWRRQNKNPDVLWLPNPMFVSWEQKIPAVLTVHDLSWLHWPEFFSIRSHFWYFPAVKRLLRHLPKTAWLAAVSNYTADDLTENFPNLKNRLQVIPPGVAESYFNPPSSDKQQQIMSRYGLTRPYLLTVGTIEPRKNHSFLWQIYAELLRRQSDFPYDLVMVGAWGWRTAKIRRLLQTLNLGDRLKILGYIPEQDKVFLYAGAKLFLYPSFYEGFGMPPLEAMAAGVPVLVSQTSSLPEVVGEAGLLLSPYDNQPWYESINWLLNDKSAYQDLVQAGQARAKLFNWSKTARLYLDLFNQISR